MYKDYINERVDTFFITLIYIMEVIDGTDNNVYNNITELKTKKKIENYSYLFTV